MAQHKVTPGETGILVHFLRARTVHVSQTLGVSAQNVNYGSEMVLTPEIIEANRDSNGRCRLLEMLDEPGSGVVRGPWPEDKPKWLEGSFEHDAARDRARAAALMLPSDEERQTALASVRKIYGLPSEALSRTTAIYGERR